MLFMAVAAHFFPADHVHHARTVFHAHHFAGVMAAEQRLIAVG